MPPVPGSSPDRPSLGRRIAGWVLVGLGALLVLGAVASLADPPSRFDDDAGYQVGYIMGALIPAAACFVGAYFLLRRRR